MFFKSVGEVIIVLIVWYAFCNFLDTPTIDEVIAPMPGDEDQYGMGKILFPIGVVFIIFTAIVLFIAKIMLPIANISVILLGIFILFRLICVIRQTREPIGPVGFIVKTFLGACYIFFLIAAGGNIEENSKKVFFPVKWALNLYYLMEDKWQLANWPKFGVLLLVSAGIVLFFQVIERIIQFTTWERV